MIDFVKRGDPGKVVNVKKWCKDMEAIIRIDKRDPQLVADVIDFISSDIKEQANGWPGWANIIGCPAKLRHHLKESKLVEQMQAKKGIQSKHPITVLDGREGKQHDGRRFNKNECS